jgi:hypothetical protein
MLEEAKSGVPPQEKLEVKATSIAIGLVKGDVVWYVITVKGGYNSWNVSKRYSQFEELALALSTVKGYPKSFELPPKRYKLFTSHYTKEFVEERRVLLENFLKKLVSIDDIAKHDTFLKFLTTDKSDDTDTKATATATKTDQAAKETAASAEDVEITSVCIPATRTMSDHILFQIDITNIKKRKSFAKWTVLKRFGQFWDMDCLVRAAFAEKLDVLNAMPAPPARRAKLVYDHMDTAFVEQRRVLLENYLQKMISLVEVVRNKDLLQFLGVSNT